MEQSPVGLNLYYSDFFIPQGGRLYISAQVESNSSEPTHTRRILSMVLLPRSHSVVAS